MRTTKQSPEITPSFYQPLHCLVVILAVAVGLLAGAVNSQATNYTWTNTTGAAFNDPTAWSPSSGPPGLNDTASFTVNGTFDVPLTNNYISNIGTLLFGAASGSGTVVLTLDFGTNTFAALSGGASSTSASGFVFGQQGTATVYIACGQLLCTNLGNNARMIIGRQNGPTAVFLTNGFVAAGNLIIVNGTSANGSKLVISGPNSSWSNSAATLVGSVSGSASNSLVITNSGSMVDAGTFQVGNGGYFNSLLLDTSGQLFTRNTGSVGASAAASNNTATVQGGALWDCGGKNILVGNSSGQNNSLFIGNNGTVSNITFLILSGAGNSLSLSGGVLKASSGITNTSGTVSGFGTIAGSSVIYASGGTLSLGLGTLVGTLTVSNNLTLVSGSTTIMKLDNSQTGSNDQVNIVGTLTEAGTLTVITNGIAPLNIGDQYQLFVGTQAGTFTTINLPSLDPSKLWNTNQLASAGILAVTFEPVVPGTTGLTNQLTGIGTTVVISGTVTGVPTPGVYWQLNNVNVTDGPQADGSTNSGSATATLTISNAQTNESGTLCLIATNSAGASTNCIALTVSDSDQPPTVSGTSDQTVIQGNNGTFNAAVSGAPAPAIQWQVNSVNIPGATGTPLILTNVQFAQNGFVYTIIASNLVSTASTNMTLHVIITPAIQTQPQSLIVTNTQSASFTVVSTNGIPAPTYQWYFNNSTLIMGATNATYTIASATPANAGSYNVQISNAAGEITSTNATLTVDSTMSAVLTPTNGAVNVCYDTPLFMAFNQTPVLSGTGKVNIYNVTNPTTPVDTIDTSLGPLQSRSIGGDGAFNTYPVITNGNTVQIYPHLHVLSSNQQYFVTVDAGIFTDTSGALYAGITTTNGWTFTTKPTGPANPLNLVVATNESGDFATVQGAIDSVPLNNTTPTLINIQNGLYTELVDITSKNNLTFRGQSRDGVLVGYPNNININGNTSTRMAFKVNANDIAIDNMTVTNMTPKGGDQAEALEVYNNAKRCILNNAVVSSFQDTILINDVTSQAYFYRSLIKGDTDFLWGLGNLFVTNCEIRTVTGGASVTQPRTTAGSNGLDFVNCMLTRTGTNVTNTTFARALGYCDGNAAFINCQIDSNLVGWTAADLTGCLESNNVEELRWWEYGNVDLLTGNPVSYNGVILTNGDSRLACAESATCWLSGWVPQLTPNILTNPVSMTVTAGMTATFNVAATGIPDPSYQWLFNTTNTLAGATNATLSITNALACNAGAYSVIVSNIAGTVTSSSATLTVVGTGPTASFTASPTFGTEPLGVTFTDTSSGSPNITLFWDFGDSSQATNAGGASFVHTYASGTYTVTLTASNAFGANSTLVSNNLITVLTAFQAWQSNYFGCTACSQAQPDADPLGKGISNTNQFLLGLNPTDPASVFRILSVVPEGTNMVITWAAAGVRTNAVQATAGDGNGGYTSTNFMDISIPAIIIGVTGDATNNYTDVGGATASPARYYRIRLVP